jgi:hypothetical protein
MTGHFSRANAGAAQQQSELTLLHCTRHGVAEDVRAGRHEAGMPACGRARRAEWRPLLAVAWKRCPTVCFLTSPHEEGYTASTWTSSAECRKRVLAEPRLVRPLLGRH